MGTLISNWERNGAPSLSRPMRQSGDLILTVDFDQTLDLDLSTPDSLLAPVQNHRHGSGRRVQLAVDEKFLSVPGDVIEELL